MALVRLCAVCGARVKQGQRCECQKLRHKRYDREHRDKERAAFYSSAAWKKVSAAARMRAGHADEYVMYHDCHLSPGQVVHHIIPLSERPDLALDMENLICVSAATHDMIHRAYDAGAPEKRDMIEQLFSIRGRGGPGSLD